jgi:uncharacterized protein YeaO (DUF488 family)
MSQEILIPHLQTESILNPKQKGVLDISVMSRHTLDDGKTPDHRIIEGINYDLWWPNLAPPARLVGDWYKKRNMPWEKFEDRYFDFLQNRVQRHAVENLVYLSSLIPVSIRCIEETPEHCHRRLLAEECARLDKDLKVYIK